jgi:predicted transcriptional regulator
VKLRDIVKEIYKIRDLDQIRLLADPLRLRLLQTFAESAKTTKQAAVELNEKVTKLYRHVDALHDAGLLIVVREQQKRGTVERTFRAVARRFEADHSLFAESQGDDGSDAVREMLRNCEAEIIDAVASSDHGGDEDERAIVMRIRGRATPEEIAELRAALKAWIDSVTDRPHGPSDKTAQFGGLIAFYPID